MNISPGKRLTVNIRRFSVYKPIYFLALYVNNAFIRQAY
jgi:hypothetical protein